MRLPFVLAALALFTSAAHAEEWSIDLAHTRVGFSVPHMVVSDVEGRFHDVKGKIDLDDKDVTKSTIELTIAAASIDTENADRDKHLKSADFFGVAKYPTVTFKSTKVAKAGKDKLDKGGVLVGDDVTLDIRFELNK